MATRREFLIGASSLALMAVKGAGLEASCDSARSDISTLRDAFETLHPGLSRYATPLDLDRRFAALEAAWAREHTRVDAYLSLSAFLATIRCGHTYANFYNQKDAVAAELFAGRDRLPFHFRWLGERMIVTAHGGDALPAGTEILAVDGRPAGHILTSLLPYARADGGNDAKRVAQLEVQGREGFETFDVFFGLTHGNRGKPFEVTTTRGRLRMEPIDLAARRAQSPRQSQDKDAPKWTLGFDTGGVARLTMPDWVVYNTKWDWRGFLDQSFEQIASRTTRALIVDLRGNEGGLDCGDEIVARCIDADMPRTAYERRVRYRRAPGHLDPYLDTWDPSFKDWGEQAELIDRRFYRLIEKEGASRAPIRPKAPRFTGKLVVLTDASNSSATFQFTDLVQSNRLGVLVGSPTGGNRRGINGGAFFFLRLPVSGLEVDLPLIGSFPATPQPDAGIVPDVVVTDTQADIAAGRDAVLNRALEIARG